MMKRSFIALLQRVEDEDELEREPFEQYAARVRPLLPTYPDEVLRQWSYDNPRTMYRYAWLNFERFIFREETWSSERIVRDVQTWNEDAVRALEPVILSPGNPSRLERYMLEHRTWPVPIIAITNPRQIRRKHARCFREPFQLLEGHHRLAYLRALFRQGMAMAEHRIWLATWV